MFPVRDSIPTRTVPVVTRALILINAVVFFFELAVPKDVLEQVVYLFGIVPARLMDPGWAAEVGFPVGSYWSLLTHQFLHGGWLHIISNMWALWIFGDNVEHRIGHFRYLIFYLLTGILASLAHVATSVMFATDPSSLLIPSLGASGAISGVLGGYLLMFPTRRVTVILFRFLTDVPAYVAIGIWFAFQLISGLNLLGGGTQMGGVAYAAHIGGFVAGLVLVKVFTIGRSRPYA